MVNSQSIVLLSSLIVLSIVLPNVSSQGTGKVQEFFKKYFGEYFPKATRSYTLYGNGLNGPADFNAALPVDEKSEGPIKSIIYRRGSPPLRQDQDVYKQPSTAFGASDNAWQPTSFDPVSFARGGHRGRSDLTSEFDDSESQIITAEDVMNFAEANDAPKEFRIESSMSFSSPDLSKSSPVY